MQSPTHKPCKVRLALLLLRYRLYEKKIMGPSQHKAKFTNPAIVLRTICHPGRARNCSKASSRCGVAHFHVHPMPWYRMLRTVLRVDLSIDRKILLLSIQPRRAAEDGRQIWSSKRMTRLGTMDHGAVLKSEHSKLIGDEGVMAGLDNRVKEKFAVW